MSYQLDKNLVLSKNINSIASEEIQESLNSLNNLGIHDAIHDIRKRLKKIRALARLVRDELGEENYKVINIYFRDLGREISDFRDLSALLEIIDSLSERYGNYLDPNFFYNLRKQIEKRRNLMETALKDRNFFSVHLVNKLNYAQKELVNWPVSSNSLQIILPSIERVYSRGKNAMENAYKYPSKENFHEWRKRVKYLWYQSLLIQSIWPQFFESFQQELDELANSLGTDHDLLVLQEKINSGFLIIKDPVQLELMNAIINKYSDFLRLNAKIKAELIYAESPQEFSKRIATCT